MGIPSGKIVSVNEKGQLVAIYVPPDTTDLMKKLPMAKALEQFSPHRDPVTNEIYPQDIQHIGKVKLEVAIERQIDDAAAGSLKALDWIYDRTVGKAKQSVESVNLTMTYQEYVANKTPVPTEEELKEIGLTVEDITDQLDLEGL